MNSADLRERITELLSPVLADDELELEDVELTPVGRRRMLRLIVDADGGVSLDRLAQTSQHVAKALDDAALMGNGSYTLEVTSRGLDRPLTATRHWRRNLGRLVRVTDTEGRQFTGRVVEVEDDEVELDVEGDSRRLAYGRIAKARVEVEFGSGDESENGTQPTGTSSNGALSDGDGGEEG